MYEAFVTARLGLWMWNVDQLRSLKRSSLLSPDWSSQPIHHLILKTWVEFFRGLDIFVQIFKSNQGFCVIGISDHVLSKLLSWSLIPIAIVSRYLLFCYFPGFNLLLSQSRYESSVVSNAICFKASEASWSGVDLFRDIIYSPSINEVKRQSVLLFIILWFDVS